MIEFILIFAMMLGLGMMIGFPLWMVVMWASKDDPPRRSPNLPNYDISGSSCHTSRHVRDQMANNLDGHRMIDQLNRWDRLNNRKY
jgi:hypothetical protein